MLDRCVDRCEGCCKSRNVLDLVRLNDSKVIAIAASSQLANIIVDLIDVTK